MGIPITLEIQVGQEGPLIMAVAHMVHMFHLAIKVGRGAPLTAVVAKVAREGLLIMAGPMVTQVDLLTTMARDHIGHLGVVVGVEAPLITEAPRVTQVDRLTIMAKAHIGHLGVAVEVEVLLIVGDLVIHLMEDEVIVIRETDIGIHEMGDQIILVPQDMALNPP